MELEPSKGLLTPRIVLEAIDEIRGRETGFHEKYGSHQNWRETFIEEIDLPTYADVYAQK